MLLTNNILEVPHPVAYLTYTFMLVHRKFDTVGGFARTAKEFKVLANALYGKPGLGSEKLTVKVSSFNTL